MKPWLTCGSKQSTGLGMDDGTNKVGEIHAPSPWPGVDFSSGSGVGWRWLGHG